MKRDYIILGLIFLALAFVLHLVHYLIFRDLHHLLIYMLGDIAFLPLEVFFVVLLVERVLVSREQKMMIKKLNMVIGAFFSELGNDMLAGFIDRIKGKEDICRNLMLDQKWTRNNFKSAVKFADTCGFESDFHDSNFEELKKLLVGKREFMLRLLENPNLLEHERFTDLLWATFHLTEELEARESFKAMPQSDQVHIQNDFQRAYSLLLKEWLYYVEHLRVNYPYLYSLIVRTQPFASNRSAVIVG
jgi:hypothetical protein